MKKFLIVTFLSAGLGSGAMLQQTNAAPVSVHVAVANIHPTEAKYDKIMGKYAAGLKAAFAEKDDKKSVAMINKLNSELYLEFSKIKVELESWIKGMSEKDKEALENRMGEKAYFKTIFEIMFDPAIGARIEKNPELKDAVRAGDEKMKTLGFGEPTEEDEDID